MIPDFEKYSLALIRDGEILHMSRDPGLRPLVDCVSKFTGLTDNCILHDKVTGLAGAMVIVHSGIITSVYTGAASICASEFLEKNNIQLNAERTVENILTKDRTEVCPMELKAMDTTDPEGFFRDLLEIFKI